MDALFYILIAKNYNTSDGICSHVFKEDLYCTLMFLVSLHELLLCWQDVIIVWVNLKFLLHKQIWS